MSLITRGLGKSQLLVTAGLGPLSSFVEVIGPVLIVALDLVSAVAKSVGLENTSVKISNLTNSLSRRMSASNLVAPTINNNSTATVVKDL